jgi:peptidoglycan/LPS O-acetylase OafA/YrhL
MRFRFIDALRGIAALAVFFCHVREFGLPHGWLEWGQLGVPVFFVISGFVIAASNADQQLTANYIGRFVLRRSLRLDPPYWVTLLLVIAFISPMSPANTLANMFYLQRIFDRPLALSASWTLCQEVQLYLFYVLSMAAFQKLRGNALVTGLAAQGALAVVSVFTTRLDWNEFFIPYWYQFFAGVLAFWCVAGRVHWGVVVAFLALVSARLYADPAAVTVVLTAALMITLRQRMTSLGGSAVPQFFGRISYSLYLTHMPVHAVVCAHTEPGPLRGIVSVAACLLAASAMHYTVERAGLRWSARVAKTAPAPRPTQPLSGFAGGETPDAKSPEAPPIRAALARGAT